MKKTDKISYREKSKQELLKNLSELRNKFVETRSKHAHGNQKDTSVFSKIKHEIAYIFTLLKQKENDN